MKTVLEEFYRRDESLRKLPLADQQRLFADWAESKEITERLTIKTFSWLKYAKCAALLLAFAAILSVSKSDHAMNITYWMLFLPSVILAIRGDYLVLTQAEQGGDLKPDNAPS